MYVPYTVSCETWRDRFRSRLLERKYFHTRTRILKNQTMVWGYLVTWSALRSLGLLSGYLVCSPGQFSGSSFMHSLWQFTPQFEHWKPCKENRIWLSSWRCLSDKHDRPLKTPFGAGNASKNKNANRQTCFRIPQRVLLQKSHLVTVL